MAGASIDLFKVNREEYRTPKHPTLMVIGPATYLSVEGSGAADGPLYIQRCELLHEATHALTQTLRQAGHDYQLGRLQCQWWADADHEINYQEALQRYWQFRLLVRVPEFVTTDLLEAAAASHPTPERIRQVQCVTLDEGLVLQMLHSGPVAEVGQSTKRMREYARKNHLHFTAPHHEIYLPETDSLAGVRARTILRRPVR